MEGSSHPTESRRRRHRKKNSGQRVAFFLVAVIAVGAVAWAVWPRNGAKTQTEYDKQTGKLSKLVSDLNKNGVMDTVSYMDGTKFVRNELDLDENGKTERWDIFLPDGKTIDKVGISTRNDGVMDAETYYDKKGLVERILQSTKRDGVYDRTEVYEAGILKRSQEDVNRDGKPDKWETYAPVDPPIPGLTITSSTGVVLGTVTTSATGAFSTAGLTIAAGTTVTATASAAGVVLGSVTGVIGGAAVTITSTAAAALAAGAGAGAGGGLVAGAGGGLVAGTSGGILSAVAVGAGVTAAVVAVTNDASASGG